MRVLAAVSGGVDSAVAAARLVDAGHDVTCVHLALSGASAGSGRTHGCCTPEDARDARRTADVLGVPFYVWDMADRFAEAVLDPFVAGYAAGRTPNPCVSCNEKIKFAAVMDRALALGFDAMATGHHVRRGPDGLLRRSVDLAKDQSYVLGTLHADQLEHALFPLGFSTKTEVRAEALARGLAVADKPDSHDICFVPSGDTPAWLADRLGAAPGDVVQDGTVVGSHAGTHGFTVGQRRGLPAAGRPRYVLRIDPVAREVHVGTAEQLDTTVLACGPVRWPSGPVQLEGPLQAQVRAHADPVDCTAGIVDGRLEVRLDTPVRGVAPGQAVVVYRVDSGGDVVVAGATCETAGAVVRAG